jgi:Zn-dependent protease with chaperone function
MSDDAIALVGRENAFVIGGHDYLFVSEEWFEELTPAERRFLIGHELSHLMMQHTEKKQLAQQSMNMLVDYLLKYIGNSAEKGTWKHYGIEAAKNVGLGTMKMLLLAMLSRSCECEADEVSARKLNSAAGGIALFERMDRNKYNRAETSWFLILIRKAISCFASHPQHDERIKFLQSIVDKNHC